MQEAEEKDTCRICSAPEEPGQPLFYPCKCSGTIRYIHQDCLTTWLSHSKKKTCDVCKHPYAFTKVYATDMPSTLPPLLLIRRLVQQALFASIFGLRAIMIAIVWLAFLPWVTVWTWRVYFTMGEWTAWRISGRDRLTELHPAATTEDLVFSNDTVAPWRNTTLLQRFATRPFWQTLSADIFAGQIIASLIVLIFVAVFLLREWISQNARPGMFEDDDLPVLPQDPLPAQPAQIRPALPEPNGRLAVPHPRPPPLNDRDARAQARHMRARRPMIQNGHLEVLPRQVEGLERFPALRDPGARPQFPLIQPPPPVSPMPSSDDGVSPRTGLGKGKAKDEGHGQGADAEIGTVEVGQRIRRRLDVDEPTEAAGNEPGPSNLQTTSTSGLTSDPRPASSHTTGIDRYPFEFTFRAHVPPANGHMTDVREPLPEFPEQSFAEPQDGLQEGTAVPKNPFPPPNVTFTFTAPDSTPEVLSRSPSPDNELSPLSSTDIQCNATAARRPPMPNSTVMTEENCRVIKLQSAPSSSPIIPPSLATYVAPEELEAGPSTLVPTEHSGGQEAGEEKLREEFKRYFRDPDLTAPDKNSVQSAAITDQNADPGGSQIQQEPLVEDEDDEDEDEDEDEEVDVVHDQDHWDVDLNRERDEDDEDDVWEPNDILLDVPGAQGPQVQVQAEIELQNDGGDDLEAGVEDDMEGALEAIGLRGPIFGVVQNAILMIFVLDTAIGFGVWLPFTLGKATALLSLDPPRALHILHLPIRAMRLVTDPFVDFFTLILGRFVFPSVWRTLGLILRSLLYVSVVCVSKTVGSRTTFQISDMMSRVHSWASLLSAMTLHRWQSSPEEAPVNISQRIDGFFDGDSTIARLVEPYFAHLGQQVRLFSEHLQRSWVSLALGHGTRERAFAISLGYAVVGVLLAIYLNVFTVGNARTAGRAVRNAVRQQLLVVKVAMFIIIELVIFPFGCGVMLDLCTIWVFPEASFESRLAFFTQALLTATFYHWVAGTMFMYQFAILLAGCRNIMRSGAMWFIKDPQDQNFHPIRDILDRPTLTQFRKLLISAFMYAMVVICGVGSLAMLLFIGSKSIFPIRWKTREPLSDVPVDLLFLQIVLPFTMRYLQPRRLIYRAAVHVWKVLASELRLTSYMFGERHRKEEQTIRYRTWSAFFRRSQKDVEDIVVTRDGQFRRVPANDNIALPRNMRATAEVLENGLPANDTARELISMQNLEATKAKRDIKSDYIVVYIPPHFFWRIIMFIAAIWTVVAIVMATCIALPVQVGRRFFFLFTSAQLHDGYSFLAGFYLLWGCYALASVVDDMNKRRPRRAARAVFPVFLAKRSLLWLSKITYIAIFLGVVIPTLLGLVADLYVVMPIRMMLNPSMVPEIRLVDMWSLGLLYCKVVVRLRQRIQLPQRLARALHLLVINGWTQLSIRYTTREIIVPTIVGLLGMILAPAGVVYALRKFLEVPLSNKFLLMHAYPGIFALACAFRAIMSAMTLLSLWSQSIRDKEFLVEMRLQNLEPSKPEEAEGTKNDVANEVVERPREGEGQVEQLLA